MRWRSCGARVGPQACAVLLLSSLLLGAQGARAFTIQTIAITGEVAPGTGGASYATFSNPVLNASGEVAFTALLQQGGAVDASNDLGLWSGNPNALGLVARRGAAAPGTGGANFNSFIAPPVLNGPGQTAFRGFLATGGGVTTSNNEGLWSEASGSLALVAREGSPGADVPAGQSYASTLSSIAYNDAGEVAYHGSLVGGGVTTADNRALWSGDAAAPSLVARKGEVAHGVGDGALYQSFAAPVLNASGETAYRAILDVGDDGLWTGAPGSVSLVAREGDAAAGVAGAEFETFLSPELNDAGRLAFQATLTQGVGGVGAGDNSGIWVGDESSLFLVAREGDATPGGGAVFESFVTPLLNVSGTVAFRGFITGGTGVYVGDENGLDQVAATGELAPGSDLGLGAATFAAVLSPVINDAGQVVFQAFLQGTGVTSDNDEALYAVDTNGQLVLVAREGTLFERRPGDSQLITEIGLVVEPDSLGESFNAAGVGQITFWMSFFDGGEGVFITAVPEPGTGALLAVGLLALAARRGRRVGAAAPLLAVAVGLGGASPAQAQLGAPGEDLTAATLNADRCEILDPSHCLLPWPSDHFTAPDAGLDTGLRVNLNVLSMPKHTPGHPIRPDEYNLNDGWSPGSMLLTLAEGIDLEASGAPLITEMDRSLQRDSATVVIDTVTGAQHLHWAELDVHATGDATRLLILRPGINLVEGRRYVVAVQNAVDAGGNPLRPSAVFETYRDAIPTTNAAIESRRGEMEEIFAVLDDAGIDRGNLHVAWRFTVMSARSLSERVLYMRDTAFAELGTAAPTFEVSSVEEVDPASDDRLLRIVEGTFQVPRFVNSPAPGARMTFLAQEGQPDRYQPDQPANFLCTIPRSASADGGDPVTPARPALYGHGVLGSAIEITFNNVRSMANEHNFSFCATDWIGISQTDIPVIVGVMFPDFSNWSILPDRLQQAYLNFLFLGRLMIHPDGFASHPAFQAGAANEYVIDPSELYYDGNSNGAVNGTAVIALAQDFTKAVLGVGSINFSTILRRSVDFDPFKILLDGNFPSEIERTIVITLIQNVWDRGEGNGYAQHITRDPYRETPVHRVLIHEGFGDHQVPNVATEVQARTLGVPVYQPALRPGRSTDVYPLYPGLPSIPSLPHDGSAMVVWDSGTPAPPTTNEPPREGFDSHEHPRNDPDARIQKSEFLSPSSRVVDVCAGAPCLVQQCGAVPCPL